MFKKFTFAIVLMSLGLCGSMYWGYRILNQWANTPFVIEKPAIVDFPPGTSLSSLTSLLVEKGAIANGLYFQVWVRSQRSYPKFQAGLYRFADQVTPAAIMNSMVHGNIYTPIAFQITIPEGYTYAQITRKLVEKGIGTEAEYSRLFRDKAFLSKLNIPSSTLEGYLYPATYSFSTPPNAEGVLTKMNATFWEKIPSDYEEKVNELGLGLHKAVIFGSLIELETRTASEMPHVSEVIWRRLKGNHALAIDAALIYGIPNYDGDIRKRDLENKKNPYNTRLHLGLPPTPICNPSIESLLAVLTPSREGYMYYVLRTDQSGLHWFSKTLDEHNRHVRDLVKMTQRPSQPSLPRKTQ